MSRELISSLSDPVWILNPKPQLEALVDFLCRLVSELCRLARIRCSIDAMSVTGNVPVSHEFRHNVSLSVKEVADQLDLALETVRTCVKGICQKLHFHSKVDAIIKYRS